MTTLDRISRVFRTLSMMIIVFALGAAALLEGGGQPWGVVAWAMAEVALVLLVASVVADLVGAVRRA